MDGGGGRLLASRTGSCFIYFIFIALDAPGLMFLNLEQKNFED